jgi:hypothetical protein
MTQRRPDFLMGEEKWELLARSRLLLNLHREGATAFEWVRALEAIANGCVVLTAPSTGLAPLVPGKHVLVSDPSRMGLVAMAALADPGLLERTARAAEELCRSLDMGGSARRLVDSAESIVAKTPPPVTSPAPVDASQTEEAPLAVWVPVETDATLQSRHQKLPREVVERRLTGARVDLVCVSGPVEGPLSRTMASLDSSGVPSNRFVAVGDQPMAVGPARNELLARGDAPYVLVLDAGDEVLGDTLGKLVSVLDGDDSMEVAYPLALLGSDMIGNAFVPEVRRLNSFRYLTRGYLVRRSWLNELGGFAADAPDHQFWLQTAAKDRPLTHLRQVGIRLWPRA